MPQVSAVIPNYNGRALLSKHLPAVLRCLQDQDQLLIVDDASTDDSVEWLVAQFRLVAGKELSDTSKTWIGRYRTAQKKVDVFVIQNEKNLRFGASANRGVELASGGLILLLNSDVSPQADVLQFLLPHFDDQKTFAVGCLEEEEQNLGGKNTLKFQRGMFIHARASNFMPGETAWVTGGSGLFDRSKWLELGGFDSRYYPAYWEDIDLAWQARQKGWRVLFEPRAIVKHQHESTNKSVFGTHKMQAVSWQNARKFVWKNGTRTQKFLHILWQPYWLWKIRLGHQHENT